MNMNLYNRELQDGYIKQRIEEYRKAANMAPVLIKVLEAYDNKIFNCKLEKAINEAIPDHYITARKEYHNINIGFYNHGNHCTLASIPIDKLIDGKRIPANIFIESARTRQADHLKRAAEMENAFNNIDSIIDQLKQLNKAIAAVLAPVPYEVQDVYRIIR